MRQVIHGQEANVCRLTEFTSKHAAQVETRELIGHEAPNFNKRISFLKFTHERRAATLEVTKIPGQELQSAVYVMRHG